MMGSDDDTFDAAAAAKKAKAGCRDKAKAADSDKERMSEKRFRSGLAVRRWMMMLSGMMMMKTNGL
jgi:hypothetical protein